MNLRTEAFALVLIAAGTAAAQRPSDRGAITDAVGRIVDAANHVNVDKMLLEFMPEAQMMNGSDSYANIESVRAAFIPAFAALRSQDVKVEQSNIAMLSSNFAWYVASGTLTVIDTSGATSAPRRFAWTMLFKNNHGDWRVLQVHQVISGVSGPSVAPAASQSGANAGREGVVYGSSTTAMYTATDTAGKITGAVLYGDPNTDAPHAEFTKFAPGFDAGIHRHTNTVTILVIKGAYLYRDALGEKRVGPGEFLRIPGGHVHWSGADAKEGAVFYVHMDAKMDQTPAR